MALLVLILASITIYYMFISKEAGRNSSNIRAEKRCPGCKSVVEDGFSVCPICKETLKRKCTSCGEPVDTAWKYCPYCENLLTESEIK